MPIYWDEGKRKRLLSRLNLSTRHLMSAGKEGLEVSANLVATHAKTRHVRAKSLSREAVRRHADRRFYVWSERLANSIHPGRVEAYSHGLRIAVHASEAYAAAVEKGGPNRRAFPFMEPALNENRGNILRILGVAARGEL